MKKLYLLLAFYGLLNGIQAQSFWHLVGGNDGWDGGYGDIAATVMDTAGNFYFSGPQDQPYNGKENVWTWNGNKWIKAGTGKGGALNANKNAGRIESMCSDKHGNIYAATAGNTYTSTAGNVYKWDGYSWTLLGGNNNALNAPAELKICASPDGHIYAAYASNYSSFSDTVRHFVAMWNGTSWTKLGSTGSDSLGINGIINAMCVDGLGNVYLGGQFYQHRPGSPLYYVNKWNGTRWGAVAAGSDTLNAYDIIDYLCVDDSNQLYVFGGGLYNSAHNPVYSYVLKYNGLTISSVEDDSSANKGIYYSPVSKRLYANGKNSVVYWNGNKWIPVGDIVRDLHVVFLQFERENSKGEIFGIATTPENFVGVIKYGTLQPGDTYIYLDKTDGNCSVHGSVKTTVYGGTPPYTYKWSNDSVAANLLSVPKGTYAVTLTDATHRNTWGSIFVDDACKSVVQGFVFSDANNNCTFDNSEQPFTSQSVEIRSIRTGLSYFGNSDATGKFTIQFPDSGTFIVQANYLLHACANLNICAANADTIYIAHIGDTVFNINLAYSVIQNNEVDLAIHPGWTQGNPGFTKQYWVMPYNLSSIALSGQATVTFNYDPNLIYQSSEGPLPLVDTVAHTLTWTISGSNIPSFTWDWFNKRFISTFLVPSTLDLNYQLQNYFSIDPTSNDCDISNNTFHMPETIKGSHDPNAKEVLPAGQITDNDSVLIYTIHFQNTGTDSTHFIRVVDTLSPNLEPASVINLTSSHNYASFRISDQGILTWLFNPIRLVDSFTNSAGSQGFITFTIRRKMGLSLGTDIANSACIYFDYNEGVKTNTTSSLVALTSGIYNLQAGGNISAKAFPNPFSDVTTIEVSGINQAFDFELFDVTGQLQMQITALHNNRFNVQRNKLSAGVYLYRINTSDHTGAFGKLIVQ